MLNLPPEKYWYAGCAEYLEAGVRPDRLLLETYRSGASVRELAALFSSNEGAIRSRLKKKGIL